MSVRKPMWGRCIRRHMLIALACVAVSGCGGGSDGTLPESSQANAAPGQAPSSPTTPTSPGGPSSEAINGTPQAQVQAGQAYSFTPTVTGANGATLTFAVQNKPAWATFSASSGQLSGTPSSAQVGSYSNIVISVSDGTTSASLAPVSITVTAAPTTTGSATLSWAAPTTNTDGSPISNLAGFKIDYGNSAGALTQTVTVSDATAISYTIQGLAAGTWYFAVSDYTSTGGSSALSTVVSKTIQ
jgi:Putative Ig domain